LGVESNLAFEHHQIVGKAEPPLKIGGVCFSPPRRGGSPESISADAHEVGGLLDRHI
jgi:hypothetical protein